MHRKCISVNVALRAHFALYFDYLYDIDHNPETIDIRLICVITLCVENYSPTIHPSHIISQFAAIEHTVSMIDKQSKKRKADSPGPETQNPESQPDATATKTLSAKERMDQFRALRLRAKSSKKENRQELYRENSRLKEDPTAVKKLEFQKSIAEEKLAKLDALEAGEDFERKRAWDWTIEESEAWDVKMAIAKQNKETSGFADYTQEASKQYTRNTASLKPDLEAYAAEKAGISSDVVAQPLIMAADGSMIPITSANPDADLNNLRFINQRPKKESIDKLIADLSRSDAARLKAQMKRGKKAGDDGDYINNRNKVFNQKVSRFYDKYTKEMRDSFERGTAQ